MLSFKGHYNAFLAKRNISLTGIHAFNELYINILHRYSKFSGKCLAYFRCMLSHTFLSYRNHCTQNKKI